MSDGRRDESGQGKAPFGTKFTDPKLIRACSDAYSKLWNSTWDMEDAFRAGFLAGCEIPEDPSRPRVVCLCGSTRFKEAFVEAYQEETDAGRIVLSVGRFMHADHDVGPDLKIKLDELHKRKINLADEIFVLNVAGYIGSSTRSEIDYAIAHNKPVRYLEPIS